jgi:REP element-mobilizing transposase RayT
MLLSELLQTSTAHEVAVFAYCLMPDHIHLVTEGRSQEADCLVFTKIFKQRTAFRWKREQGQKLWQESFHDHVLRDSEDTRAVVRYVLENPVRAGLVGSPREFPYLGSLVYGREELLEWAFGWDSADVEIGGV